MCIRYEHVRQFQTRWPSSSEAYEAPTHSPLEQLFTGEEKYIRLLIPEPSAVSKSESRATAAFEVLKTALIEY